MAGGSCEATVRSNGRNNLVVRIPAEYWGLLPNKYYRVFISPRGSQMGFIPYSYEAKVYLEKDRGGMGKVPIPRVLRFSVGDDVHIWVGDVEDYGNGALPHGRGRTKAERKEDLERAQRLLP